MATSTCPTTPSAASVCDVLDGKPGAIPRFLGHWLLRSALIMPGLVVAGVRDKRLVTGALASSTLVSLFLLLYTVVERARKGEAVMQLTGRSHSHALRARQVQAQLRARKSKMLHVRKAKRLQAARRQQLQLSGRRRQMARRMPTLALAWGRGIVR